MKKKAKPVCSAEQSQQNISQQDQQATTKPAKKSFAERMTVFYFVWSFVQFGLYIAIDALRVWKQGWTTANIIVTAALGVQLALFLILHAFGSSHKQSKKAYKASKKWIKITKKICMKSLSLAATITLLLSAKGNFDPMNLIVLGVTLLSLAILFLQIVQMIVMWIIKRRLRRKMEAMREATAQTKQQITANIQARKDQISQSAQQTVESAKAKVRAVGDSARSALASAKSKLPTKKHAIPAADQKAIAADTTQQDDTQS